MQEVLPDLMALRVGLFGVEKHDLAGKGLSEDLDELAGQSDFWD